MSHRKKLVSYDIAEIFATHKQKALDPKRVFAFYNKSFDRCVRLVLRYYWDTEWMGLLSDNPAQPIERVPRLYSNISKLIQVVVENYLIFLFADAMNLALLRRKNVSATGKEKYGATLLKKDIQMVRKIRSRNARYGIDHVHELK